MLFTSTPAPIPPRLVPLKSLSSKGAKSREKPLFFQSGKEGAKSTRLSIEVEMEEATAEGMVGAGVGAKGTISSIAEVACQEE